jgi:hypothetical protein
MPRKAAQGNEEPEIEPDNENSKAEIRNLSRMLAAVLSYLSDDELEEIDIEFLLDDTEGLREWWDRYQESNKKEIEEEIKKSLDKLSLKELKKIQEQITEKQE